MMAKPTKRAFVMMPFDIRYMQVYRDVYRPALIEAGFLVQRGDDYHTTNPITLDIERAIIEADIVLCDITGGNPNVFYELGLAHAIGKRVILVASLGEK